MGIVSRFAFLNCDSQILSGRARLWRHSYDNNGVRKRVHLRRITLTLIAAFENFITAIK